MGVVPFQLWFGTRHPREHSNRLGGRGGRGKHDSGGDCRQTEAGFQFRAFLGHRILLLVVNHTVWANTPSTASATITQGSAANSPQLLTLEGGFRGQPTRNVGGRHPGDAHAVVRLGREGRRDDREGRDDARSRRGLRRRRQRARPGRRAPGDRDDHAAERRHRRGKWTPDPRRPRRLRRRHHGGLVDRLRPDDHTAGRGAAGRDVDAPDAAPRRRELRRHRSERRRAGLEARPGPPIRGPQTRRPPRHARRRRRPSRSPAPRTARSPRTTSSATRRRTPASGPSTRSTSSSLHLRAHRPGDRRTRRSPTARTRGDCMYVGAVPQGFVGGDRRSATAQSFQGKKVYGALYGPWITVTDPLGTGADADQVRSRRPATCMGVYARIETTRGIWKAPAGDEARLLGALDVEYQLSDAEHTDLVEERQRQRHPRRCPAPASSSTRRGRSAPTRAGSTSTSGCCSTT